MYNHAPPGYLCPFCAIIQARTDERVLSVQSDVILRPADVTTLVSSHQWAGNEPNILIVPNEHAENLYDLPLSYAGPIQAAARQMAFALKAVYCCDGVSLRQHNEPAGSQDVWHYHVHVTPRWQGDGFYGRVREKQLMSAEARASHVMRLREYLLRRP